MKREYYVTSTETVYRDDDGVTVQLWGRGPDGERRQTTVTDFEPYFYVPAAEQDTLKPREHSELERIEDADIPSLFGDDVVKVVATHPGGVPSLKEQYDKTFEADVPFTNRFRVDTGIKTGVRARQGRASVDGIEPVEMDDAPVRYCYFDIEIDDANGFPVQDGTVEHTDSEVLSIVAYDSWEEEYHGFLLLPSDDVTEALPTAVETGEPPGELDALHYFGDEEELLRAFFGWVSDHDPDVLLAWNIGFDAAYLVERAAALGVDPGQMGRGRKEASHDNRRGETTVSGRVVYDLMAAWEAMQYTDVSSSLNNAASMELGGDQKIEHEEGFRELWQQDTEKMLAYNAKDVELMVQIDEEAGVMQDRRELKEAVGADFEFTIEANDFIEMLVRRKVDEWGVAAPTKSPPPDTDSEYDGAYTFPAFEGIEQNVVSIDLSSLYPYTMWMLNSSPETYVGQHGEITVDSADVCWAPNGAVFAQEEDGLFRELVDEALELTQQAGERRDEHDPGSDEWEYWNQVREARKRIRNALYGVLGWVWFFLFHEPTAEAITTMGQEVIKESAEWIDENTVGEVVYGDTDSCYISWPNEWDIAKCVRRTQDVAATLNEDVYPELAAEYGMGDVECKWEIELEDASERMFQAGKKKRYAKRVVWKEGMDATEVLDEPEIGIKGFEYKRSDTASLTAGLQKDVLTSIVSGDSDESIREAVFQAAQRITRTEPDWDAIGIPGGIGQELDEYDSDTAQVRAAKASNQLLGMSIGKGDKPKRVYLEEKNIENNGESLRTDVIAFTDSTDIAPLTDQLYVDVGKMRDTLIRQPIGRILTPIGIDVDAAMTGRVQQAISDWV